MFEGKDEITIHKLKKNLIILIALNFSLIIFAVVYTLLFSPGKVFNEAAECVFKERYSLYCPGCGGTRGLQSFLKFDLIGSFIYYPPIPISAIVIFIYDLKLSLTLIRGDSSITDKYRYYSFLLIPISIILSFIIKNVLLFYGIDLIGDIL